MFLFPHPVNEKAARSTAGMVGILAVITGITDSPWLYGALVVGFVMRVWAGPRFSLFGQLSVRYVATLFGAPTLVAGPPKQFAQSIGLGVSSAAWILFSLGYVPAAHIMLALLCLAAGCEALLGICFGCIIFSYLIKAHIVPEQTCQVCANLGTRRAS